MRRALRLYRPCALIWLLLAATLFMRAVMPAGYMAEVKAGEIVVSVCNSDAKMRIALPAKQTGKSHEKEAPCAFAGMAHAAADLPELPILIAPLRQAELRASHPVRPASTAPPRLLPFARAPPATV